MRTNISPYGLAANVGAGTAAEKETKMALLTKERPKKTQVFGIDDYGKKAEGAAREMAAEHARGNPPSEADFLRIRPDAGWSVEHYRDVVAMLSVRMAGPHKQAQADELTKKAQAHLVRVAHLEAQFKQLKADFDAALKPLQIEWEEQSAGAGAEAAEARRLRQQAIDISERTAAPSLRAKLNELRPKASRLTALVREAQSRAMPNQVALAPPQPGAGRQDKAAAAEKASQEKRRVKAAAVQFAALESELRAIRDEQSRLLKMINDPVDGAPWDNPKLALKDALEM